MKKSLFALACLGSFAGIAQAQTSVVMYGSIDGGLRYLSNVDAAGNHRLTMGSTGTSSANRWGFKGVEELGGGMNAHYNLEGGFNSGTGAVADTARLFNRLAFVGIGGNWGSLDLGRQNTVAFKTVGAYDPFNYKYASLLPVPQGSVSAGIRFDNDMQYSVVLGPLTLRAEHAFGEMPGQPSASSANAAGLTYAQGPLTGGVAYTLRKMGAGATSGNLGGSATNVATLSIPAGLFEENKHWTAGGAYTFGAVRLAVGYADEKQHNGPRVDTRIKTGWIGGSYALTPAIGLTSSWYQTKTTAPNSVAAPTGFDGKKDMFIVAATYALSKRTYLYAEIDSSRFSGSAAGSATLGGTAASPGTAPFGQKRQTGVSVGINRLL